LISFLIGLFGIIISFDTSSHKDGILILFGISSLSLSSFSSLISDSFFLSILSNFSFSSSSLFSSLSFLFNSISIIFNCGYSLITLGKLGILFSLLIFYLIE